MVARKLLGAVIAGLLLSSLSVPVAHARSICGRADITDTFSVTVKVDEDLYALGETAKFYVQVNRVVEGQDLGPVGGARIGVGVTLDDVHLIGGGITGEDGRSVIKVRIKDYASPGLADVWVSASKRLIDVPGCHLQYEYEYGDIEKLRLFRVSR